jgi:hypothetical protein
VGCGIGVTGLRRACRSDDRVGRRREDCSYCGICCNHYRPSHRGRRPAAPIQAVVGGLAAGRHDHANDWGLSARPMRRRGNSGRSREPLLPPTPEGQHSWRCRPCPRGTADAKDHPRRSLCLRQISRPVREGRARPGRTVGLRRSAQSVMAGSNPRCGTRDAWRESRKHAPQ